MQKVLTTFTTDFIIHPFSLDTATMDILPFRHKKNKKALTIF